MHSNRPPRALPGALALAAAVALSSCAAFNRGEIVLARHVSIGQELMDLQQARDAGAITESEYRSLKAKVFELVDEVDVDGWFDESDHDHDHHHEHDDDGDRD